MELFPDGVSFQSFSFSSCWTETNEWAQRTSKFADRSQRVHNKKSCKRTNNEVIFLLDERKDDCRDTEHLIPSENRHKRNIKIEFPASLLLPWPEITDIINILL